MESFRDLIGAIGTAPLSKAFGVKESHVRAMRSRNSVPAVYWGPLLAAAHAAGHSDVTFESLLDMRAARFVWAKGPSPTAAFPSEDEAAPLAPGPVEDEGAGGGGER